MKRGLMCPECGGGGYEDEELKHHPRCSVYLEGVVPTNRKTTPDKLEYSLLPIYPQQEAVRAFMDGIKSGKYKAWDWEDNPRPYSVYFSKIRRHLDAWKDGEDVAEDSGVKHLGHAIADLMILLDWINSGVGIDDRRKPNKDGGCWD